MTVVPPMQSTSACLDQQEAADCQRPGDLMAVERGSVFADGDREAAIFKWIESEKAGRDLGEDAIRRWVKYHWCGFLRARWLEHLQGRRFWVELDNSTFGLLLKEFTSNALLLDR